MHNRQDYRSSFNIRCRTKRISDILRHRKVHICPKAFLEVIDDYEILTYYSIDDMIIVKAGLLTLGVLCETHGVVTQGLLNDINSMHDMLQEVFNRECEEKDKSRNYEQLAMTE